MKISFFDSRVGKFIEELDKSTRGKIPQFIDLLRDYGHEIGPPFSTKIANNIFELRISGKVAVRLFYTFYRDEAIILHGFIKKTQKTPRRELETAQRKLDLLHRI